MGAAITNSKAIDEHLLFMQLGASSFQPYEFDLHLHSYTLDISHLAISPILEGEGEKMRKIEIID